MIILHSNTTMEVDFEIVISGYETRSFVNGYKPSLSEVIATSFVCARAANKQHIIDHGWRHQSNGVEWCWGFPKYRAIEEGNGAECRVGDGLV